MIDITVSQRFAISAEALFDAWLDPARAGRFLFATPDGHMTKVEIDARVGGEFAIVEQRPAGEACHYGRYERIDRPHGLIFLFRATMAGQGSEEGQWTRVTMRIAEEGEGSLLMLHHAMDPQWADYADQTRRGWTMILTRLSEILSVPSPDN